MKSLKANPNQTYKQLLISVRKLLSKKYSQKPQLSSSHKIVCSLRPCCPYFTPKQWLTNALYRIRISRL